MALIKQSAPLRHRFPYPATVHFCDCVFGTKNWELPAEIWLLLARENWLYSCNELIVFQMRKGNASCTHMSLDVTEDFWPERFLSPVTHAFACDVCWFTVGCQTSFSHEKKPLVCKLSWFPFHLENSAQPFEGWWWFHCEKSGLGLCGRKKSMIPLLNPRNNPMSSVHFDRERLK